MPIWPCSDSRLVIAIAPLFSGLTFFFFFFISLCILLSFLDLIFSLFFFFFLFFFACFWWLNNTEHRGPVNAQAGGRDPAHEVFLHRGASPPPRVRGRDAGQSWWVANVRSTCVDESARGRRLSHTDVRNTRFTYGIYNTAEVNTWHLKLWWYMYSINRVIKYCENF